MSRAWWILAWAAVAMMVAMYFSVDRLTVTALQDRPRWLGSLASVVSEAGEGYVVLIPAATAMGYFYWRGRRKAAGAAAFVFTSCATAGLAGLMLKVIFARWRPSRLFTHGYYGFELFQLRSDQLSFPSGHVTTATAAALALSIVLPRWKWVWWAYPLVIAAARLLAVAHYPSDLLGGALMGVAGVLVARHVFEARGWWPPREVTEVGVG